MKKTSGSEIETLKCRFLNDEIGNSQEAFTLLTKMTEIRSRTSSRTLVFCAKIRQVIQNLSLRSRSSRIDQNKPKRASAISKNEF